MTTTETRAVNDAREADMREEVCDRLDHMRAVADARARVRALVEAAAELGWTHAAALYDAHGAKHTLTLNDLRVLLGAEFTPTRDTKQGGTAGDKDERVCWSNGNLPDDDDETGLHREQATKQLGYPSPRGRDRV
jgi:hypothetical protein